MDIFIHNVPSYTNHVELRIFLGDQLKGFGILAFDVFKKVRNEWAILTVANADKGAKFLAHYGNRGSQLLFFQSAALSCKQSNRRGQPEPLKVVSLLQKEEDMQAKLHSKVSLSQTAGSAQATLPFQTLMTGVWDYDHHGELTLVLNELGETGLEKEEEQEDIDDPDLISILDPDKSRMRYYRSTKALGHLYRNIDEKKFFDRMKGDFEAQRIASGGESLIQKLERYINRETVGLQWDQHTRFAEDLREYYETNMVDIMDSLRAHRDKPLTELEVFSGNILGKKERASTRFIRAANQEVQERFNRDISAIIRSIIHGDDDEYGDGDAEALPRAIACWKVALETKGWENQVMLRSWKYVAAAVCLDQLFRFRAGQLRPL